MAVITLSTLLAMKTMKRALEGEVNSLDVLPENRKLVFVKAHEFGQLPFLVLVRFIQLKDNYCWMLLKETTGKDRDTYLGDEVHGWLPLSQMGELGENIMEWESENFRDGKRRKRRRRKS